MISKALSILMIDDSPEDREIYRSYLELHTEHIFTFLEEEDAEKGLEICAQVELDCIFLDYHLPGVNGLNFLKQLQDLKKCKDVPIVMITGRGNESVAVEALKLGASDYLLKSEITPESLYRAAKNAIDKHEANLEIQKQIRQKELAEDELRKSEEKLRMLIEAVKDYALIMLDTDGRVVSWNSGASRIFGYHASEILGQKIRKVFIQEDIRKQEPENEFRTALENGWAENDRWYAKRDGTHFWASGILRPIFDLAGICTGFVKILRDQTEKRMTENQLREAVQALNEALHNRDEFLNNASHELKTPLTSLKLQIQLARKKLEQGLENIEIDSLSRSITKTESHVNRLANIVDDLLDVSRIHENRLKLNIGLIHLTTLVKDCADYQKPFLAASGRELNLDVIEDVSAFVDAERVGQILKNLLTNVAKFPSQGPLCLSLETQENYAVVRVTDNECPLSQKELEKVFNKYERLDPENFVSEMGLGLYISRKIAEAHKGSLTAFNERSGCTFELKLPLQEILQNDE